MALFGKENRERLGTPSAVGGEEQKMERDALARDTQPGNSEVSAYLGKGSRITGKLAFEGTVRVDGQVEGEIAAQDTLLVGESAILNAKISGSSIIINGKVTGDITATKRVEIRAPGKLFGNVTTPCLIIQEGVVFEGHCSMGGADKSDRKITPFPKDEKKTEGNGVAAPPEATK